MAQNITLEQCISFPIPEAELLEVTEKAKDWAIMHGAGMRSKTNFCQDSLNFAPFLLTPSSFPRKEFEKAVALQTIVNRLMHNVAHDEEFLTTTLAETIKVDEFTGNLFNIYKKVLSNGYGQDLFDLLLPNHAHLQEHILKSSTLRNIPIGTLESYLSEYNNRNIRRALSLGILRSDYLAHMSDDNAIKQVEINTIASSFGGISTHMLPLQSYVLGELGQSDKLKNMPQNKALSGICDGLIRAWEIYSNPQAVILFVIEDVSYNICDQRFHEFYIREKCPHIKVLRRTLSQIYKSGKLSLNKELILEEHQIAVIYFRAGYEPGHYHSQDEWDARYMMECSTAIKCPSIHYHLAGTKKVQQALAEPEMLQRFINDPEEIKAVGKIFTGLYSLDDNDVGNASYEMALREAERFVLKPQREGGGNNVYGLDIPDVLRKMSRVERSAWILMDLIHPPVSKGYMIRPGGTMPPPLVDVVSELGIFGVVIGDVDNIICNYQAGHMLRTKISTANEGGVAAGLGALDSPYLVD